MRVSVVQHDIAWKQASTTRARLEPMVAAAAAAGSRLVVLTEMFATGFCMEPDEIAEPVGGPTEAWLVEQAARQDVWIIGSVAQWPADVSPDPGADPDRRAVNAAVIAAPDGSVRRYEKMHPFSFAGEHEHYRPGDKPLTVDIDGVRTSVFVCYDLRFADDFWALAHDTDCYVVVANWPEPRREHWRALLRARAIENQAYVIGANRVGRAGDLPHTGDSVVLDPLGRALVEAAHEECVISADVDPDVVVDVRTRYPFLADRR